MMNNTRMRDDSTVAMGLTPKGQERQRKILEAARDVFLEQGFERASIHEIMQRAGGSISTLYRLYGNKLGLFEAMIMQSTSDLFPITDESDIWTDNVEESLLQFGQVLLEVLGQTEARSIRRIALSVSSADSEAIRKVFYEQGPRRVQRLLAAYLTRQKLLGKVNVVDVDIASAQFIEMVKSPWYHKAEFGFPIESGEPERSLQQAVVMFMQGVVVN